MTESIFKQEERQILLQVEKAKLVSNNSQIIGRNGELPLLNFLNKYLPPTLKAVSGHFLTPKKRRSPQIDCMIIDSRYPLLGLNSDDSVLVMAHSVLRIIELKTNLRAIELTKTLKNYGTIESLFKNDVFEEECKYLIPQMEILAYNIRPKLSTIRQKYFDLINPVVHDLALKILRSNKNEEVSASIFFGMLPEAKLSQKQNSEIKERRKDDYALFLIEQASGLGDLYYEIVQDSYYLLGSREYDFDDIGGHLNDYLDWSTI